jgi:GTP-binding protein EngB required for normal cell division
MSSLLLAWESDQYFAKYTRLLIDFKAKFSVPTLLGLTSPAHEQSTVSTYDYVCVCVLGMSNIGKSAKIFVQQNSRLSQLLYSTRILKYVYMQQTS